MKAKNSRPKNSRPPALSRAAPSHQHSKPSARETGANGDKGRLLFASENERWLRDRDGPKRHQRRERG